MFLCQNNGSHDESNVGRRTPSNILLIILYKVKKNPANSKNIYVIKTDE
jgi:hypothetical protein